MAQENIDISLQEQKWALNSVQITPWPMFFCILSICLKTQFKLSYLDCVIWPSLVFWKQAILSPEIDD